MGVDKKWTFLLHIWTSNMTLELRILKERAQSGYQTSYILLQVNGLVIKMESQMVCLAGPECAIILVSWGLLMI